MKILAISKYWNHTSQRHSQGLEHGWPWTPHTIVISNKSRKFLNVSLCSHNMFQVQYQRNCTLEILLKSNCSLNYLVVSLDTTYHFSFFQWHQNLESNVNKTGEKNHFWNYLLQSPYIIMYIGTYRTRDITSRTIIEAAPP